MMNHVRNSITKGLSSLTLSSSNSVKQQAKAAIITNVNQFDRSYTTQTRGLFASHQKDILNVTTINSRSMSSTTTPSDDGSGKEESQSNIAANQEWNEFQASIHQDTNDSNSSSSSTASTTSTTSFTTTTSTKKRRGGKTARRAALKEAQLQKKLRNNPKYDPAIDDKPKIINGFIVPKIEYDEEEERELQFPNLRYSDEETQSLLEEAYRNIPTHVVSVERRI
jgi:N-acetylmuramoyl-L-alanine amidase CwlA